MTRCFLVKNGVPYDLAMSMDDDWAAAHAVVLGEWGGGKFCDRTMSWVEQK